MREREWKKAAEQIRMPRDMRREVTENVRRRVKAPKRRAPEAEGVGNAGGAGHGRILRMAASLMLLLTAAVFLSIPVRAGIRNFVEERMRQMPAEETEAFAEVLEAQEEEADGSTRDYTQEEQARMGELRRAYQLGTFPEGELAQVSSPEEAPEGELCYVKETSEFRLPQRKLTDEELLQIIDFQEKRDYSLAAAAAPALKEQRAAQEREAENIAAGGGITKEEAIAAAEGFLKSEYGEKALGMEVNCYADAQLADIPVYCVTFSIQSQDYYYFYISGADGSLVETHHSSAR